MVKINELEYLSGTKKIIGITKSSGVIFSKHELTAAGAVKGDLVEIFWRIVCKQDDAGESS